MSQTPTQPEESAEDYKLGWVAINKLIDQGFSWSGNERNRAFLNTRDAPFASISAVTGLDFKDDGRSVAAVDWDCDGDLDLFVANRTGPRLRFLRNGLDGDGGFLQLKLQSASGNRDAIGARVEVLLRDPHAAPLLQTRRAGGGYLAQSSGWMHFGLGSAAVQAVRVSWPDGKQETFSNVQAKGRYLLVQGSGQAQASTAPAKAQNLAASTPQPPRARSSARVVLATPVPMPVLEVESVDGRKASLFGVAARAREQAGSPQATLVQLWASWCAPCAEELAACSAAAEEIQAAGLAILALNIEPESAREQAQEMLARIEWPHASAFAAGSTVEILDTLQGAILRQDIRIPVPSSFLVDGDGNLVAFYLGRVEPAQLLQDLELLSLSPEERLTAATPFPGHWFAEPPTLSLMQLEKAFLDRGLHATAREYQPGWMYLQHGRLRANERQLLHAEELFRRALAVGPYYAEANAALGYTLHMQGKAEEAVAPYRRALELDPNNESTIFNLGLAQLALQDHDAVQLQVGRLRALGSRLADELESRQPERKEN